MKFLATIGALTLICLWAALAITYPGVVASTAVLGFILSLIFIWDLK